MLFIEINNCDEIMFTKSQSYRTSIMSSLLVVYLYTLAYYTAEAALTVQPVNTVSRAGTRVQLRCTTNRGGSPAPISWYFGTTQDEIVSFNCQLDSSFPQYSVIRTSPGQCDLVINSAALELATTYSCSDARSAPTLANLTVIESCPTCNQSSFNAAIGDTITMICVINYRGSSVPVLQWFPGSSATDCSRGSTVCSSLSVNIEPGMTTVESQSCSVTFPSAVHVPQCNNWTSTEITVSYLSRTLTITGAANNSDVTLNDGPVVLVCHADGHPTPTYRWLDISSGKTTDGAQYTVSTAGEYNLMCIARNYVAFVPHGVSARFYVNATGAVPTTAFTTATSLSVTTLTAAVTDNAACTCQDAVVSQYAVIVLGVFCAVFFIGFIIALIYILCTRRKPQATGEAVTDNNSLPLSDITNRQPTMTYEPLDVNTQRPVNYQQLPSQTGHDINTTTTTSTVHQTTTKPLHMNS